MPISFTCIFLDIDLEPFLGERGDRGGHESHSPLVGDDLLGNTDRQLRVAGASRCSFFLHKIRKHF